MRRVEAYGERAMRLRKLVVGAFSLWTLVAAMATSAQIEEFKVDQRIIKALP